MGATIRDRKDALTRRKDQDLFAVSAQNLSAVLSQSVSVNSCRDQHRFVFLKTAVSKKASPRNCFLQGTALEIRMGNLTSQSPRGRSAVLGQVKRDGPVTAEILAAKLGVTGMAVRQHLEHLEQAGLVTHEARAGSRGRPSKLWRVTQKADSFFANTHAALAVDLINQTRKAFGEEGLGRLIALRTAEQEQAYIPQIERGKSLRSRLERLAEIRSKEGYMAEIRRDGSNSWLIMEHHCPICSAARACSGICREELKLFQRVLGRDVRVERVSHILAGAERCAYRVSPV